MRILCTNDDGIHAPGLKTLEAIARALSDDVWIVAPETDQSGVSHSLSLNDPLRLREISDRHFAVKGTPTDCVIMGIRQLMRDHRPDLVLSGVNRGQNVAEDVSYSGTVAGAIEGTLLGVPSIALSQAYGAGGRDALKWHCAEHHGPKVVRKILEMGIDKGILVNVNFPALPADEVRGVKVVRQGLRDYGRLQIDRRTDPRGYEYYWFALGPMIETPGHSTDLEAIADGFVSVTPLHLDMTHDASLARLAEVYS